ncbi:CoA transferase [Sphingobium subterraneum]|uniref:2-methylfumaryl-CoA isomerase n=1 Tax=Sphingobium subterraneum TaxID=627688 RepID=A0A841IYZ5_9SPHN|nr:CoA transferase [Sphingobium subterraneum]MBB6123352.1 2-methylfumaryl-CoA isomerase [Sphingobium subterraneum]
MYRILEGLRIIEGASFIAAPSCGLHLLQMGAQVIRFDDIGGGPDFDRWPIAPNGRSLYWEGLNKGKKSIAIDLRRPEGRELAVRLVTAPGKQSGIFLTNFPEGGFLAHEKLAAQRQDLITVRVMGWADGTPAVDYTVNSAVGVPAMTGPVGSSVPVNHVLPAWDLMAGAYAAFALLAMERQRAATGQGGELKVPLSDLAIASLGHLGQIAEVTISGQDRPRMGNDLNGAFGRDFETADGARVMIVALTPRQWTGLVAALGIGAAVAAIEQELGVSFDHDAGMRFVHRDRLFPLVEAAVRLRKLPDLPALFNPAGVCWGPYQTLGEALAGDPRFGPGNPVLHPVDHASGYRYLTPGAAGSLTGRARGVPTRAPMLGEHTDEVLADILGLSASEIGALHDHGVVANRMEP